MTLVDDGWCCEIAGLWLAGTVLVAARLAVWADEAAGTFLAVSARGLTGAGIDCGTAKNELPKEELP